MHRRVGVLAVALLNACPVCKEHLHARQLPLLGREVNREKGKKVDLPKTMLTEDTEVGRNIMDAQKSAFSDNLLDPSKDGDMELSIEMTFAAMQIQTAIKRKLHNKHLAQGKVGHAAGKLLAGQHRREPGDAHGPHEPHLAVHHPAIDVERLLAASGVFFGAEPALAGTRAHATALVTAATRGV